MYIFAAANPDLTVAVSALLLFILFSVAIRLLKKAAHPLAAPLAAVRNMALPTGVLLYLALFVYGFPADSRVVRIIETLLWLELVWVLLSLVEVMLFARAGDTWRSRVPGLLVDIIRFTTIIIGAGFVIAGVWDRDLGGFLATLGVGSIVLGLALQDTLGSLMAGIALLFERPFQVGDWIRVADVLGRVTEVNWRSVRICTRENDIIIVPNSVLGKERIVNYSRPTELHGVQSWVSFSYDSPPNRVRRVLAGAVAGTKDILQEPRPSIRTKAYNDSSVQYEMKYFITRFDRLPEIESDLMTAIWYGARRGGLKPPYPVRTVNKTEMAPPPVVETSRHIKTAIRGISFFSPLNSEELDALISDAVIQEYAAGETVVRQGEEGSAMFIIRKGSARVVLRSADRTGRQIALLKKDDFFGEMSLLTGERRSADVVAAEDLELILIYKEALSALLERRPDLSTELAALCGSRKSELGHIAEEQDAGAGYTLQPPEHRAVVIDRIKRFFGI